MTTETRVLRPDRELDALAAEKLLGYVWITFGLQGGWFRVLRPDTPHSRDIGGYDAGLEPPRSGWWDASVPKCTESMDAAMLLVEALRAMGLFVMMSASPGKPWVVRFSRLTVIHDYTDASLPRAVTVAAILAAGGNPYQEAL